MKIYSDTELDNDIKCVKELITNYSSSCKNIGINISKLNKTVTSRICFISSQFKNILPYSNLI